MIWKVLITVKLTANLVFSDSVIECVNENNNRVAAYTSFTSVEGGWFAIRNEVGNTFIKSFLKAFSKSYKSFWMFLKKFEAFKFIIFLIF